MFKSLEKVIYPAQGGEWRGNFEMMFSDLMIALKNIHMGGTYQLLTKVAVYDVGNFVEYAKDFGLQVPLTAPIPVSIEPIPGMTMHLEWCTRDGRSCDWIEISGLCTIRQFQLMLERLYKVSPFDSAEQVQVMIQGDHVDKHPYAPKTPERMEQRWRLMKALRDELMELQREEEEHMGVKSDEVRAEAKKIKHQPGGGTIQACQYLRSKLGCGLREAKDIADGL